MSTAAATREAVRRRPFLHEALRAGVVNYTAVARLLDVGDTEAVAAALRRYARDLADGEAGTAARGTEREARVTMRSGLGRADDPNEALLAVGDAFLAPDAGSLTGVLVTGDTGAGVLRAVLNRFAVEDIDVEAAGVAGGSLLVVVSRRDGPDALRIAEDALGTTS